MTQEEMLKMAFANNEVPYGWNYCFNDQCPRHEECIAYLSTQFLKEGKDCGYAVFPNAYRNGSCRHFKKARIIRTAWGFGGTFDNVKKKDAGTLKAEVRGYLGSRTTFYRYHRGELRLSPSQQAWIANLFKQYGYDEVKFQHYQEEIDLRGR